MKYIYDEAGETVPEPDILAWSRFLTEHQRVAEATIGDAWVSTVYLGIDHRFSGEGPPLVFETMVFPNRARLLEAYTRRYSTLAEAKAGHDEVVAMVEQGALDDAIADVVRQLSEDE